MGMEKLGFKGASSSRALEWEGIPGDSKTVSHLTNILPLPQFS